MAKTKKVDVKAIEKARIMEIVKDALMVAGISTLDGDEYGMTKGTLIARTDICDVQIKPITPKAGVERYEVEVEAE